MSRKPCNFYNPTIRGGCRRGDACHFLHAEPSDSSNNVSSPGRHTTSPRERPAMPSSPPGICGYFWNYGSCNRGSACRYRHQEKPEESLDQDAENSSGVRALIPFLTDQGLAKVAGAGSDAYFAPRLQAPTKVQNGLRPFLREEFRFSRPSQVYNFVSLLYSASSNDPSWSTEDGQLLLNQMADPKGRGGLRFSSIINWPNVALDTTPGKDTLSFQRGYLPLLKYLSSEYVVQSILSHCKNALYSLIIQNFDHFAEVIESCMDEAILKRKSFKDLSSPSLVIPNASQVLKTLIVVLFECVTLFKNAVASYPRLKPLILKLEGWTNAWVEGINADPPIFEDDFSQAAKPARNHIVKHIMDSLNRLVSIVSRDDSTKSFQKRPTFVAPTGSNEGVIAALETSYDGPGEERQDGPRHDNDFVDIQQIRIAPTHAELISPIPPFLPANIYGAPHPHPIHSMQRLLDTQFRLLREELTAPLRQSVKLVLDDLYKPQKSFVHSRLAGLVDNHGGKYRGHVDGQNMIMFNVYTNVGFVSLTAEKRGISATLTFDSPPGRARSTDGSIRKKFWENPSGKRLMQGSLIALIWKTGLEIAIHLGTIASSARDLVASAANSADKMDARVVFFDPKIQLRIFESLNSPDAHRSYQRFLVEAPVMFESIRPFLEALRVEPETVPFGRYLVHRPPTYFATNPVGAPEYTQVPGFSFQLKALFPEEAGIEDLRLGSEPATIDRVRAELSQNSRLDPSQAHALVDALTRELVLIQGPPGTGKSYTGVELLRVLIQNKVRPILMIAFTNHALDHMLRSVLDAGITKKIVRLGSRSKDERVSQFSLDNLEHIADRSRLHQVSNAQYRELKLVEEDIRKLLKDFSKEKVDHKEIMSHLDTSYGNHFVELTEPPRWISILFEATRKDDGEGAWKKAGQKGQLEEEDSLWSFWRDGRDLEFLQKPDIKAKEDSVPDVRPQPTISTNPFSLLAQEASSGLAEDTDVEDGTDVPVEEHWQINIKFEELDLPEPEKEKEVAKDDYSLMATSENPPPDSAHLNPADLRLEDFFREMGYEKIPLVPSTRLPIQELLANGEMWSLSPRDRKTLCDYWTEEIKRESRDTNLQDFDRLREKHAEVLQRFNNITNEARRQLLQNVDIIGCTTTGAAQLTSLLNGIAPKVMLVEEAGQVLEAHCLGSLVKGVEHMILIGDPLQLRPTIQNFALSMDNPRGRLLYKFDMSLMERLASSGLPMSRIDIQRRMRPSISSLIRNTLYPGLQDHELVQNYPHIRGMAKDIFFFSHNHKESGGEDETASKYNMFEVSIIVDLVLYLLRQGPYSGEGDIVVLCAYLGQLAKLRDALASKVAVLIDERDQQELSQREEEKDVDGGVQLEQVKVSQRVKLRTIDNFQGEEAKIVILSLVRNSGAGLDEEDGVSGAARPGSGNIGFLKSENRTNVALSRAKEGLYILGNAANLSSRSKMWESVIEELRGNDSVGEGFPIQCDRHPEDVHVISKPGELPRSAPDGGCLRSCDYRLPCGHMCPYKCHSDDSNHVGITCSQPCTRLCSRNQHPCPRACNDPCSQCQYPISNVELPCGHYKDHVPCSMLDQLENVICDEQVEKKLLGCDHKAVLRCSQDPVSHQCRKHCNGILSCCGRNCSAHCYQCRDSRGMVSSESTHHPHPCEKLLFCGHRCGKNCSQNHECNTECRQSCRQECAHTHCRQACSSPCAPCQEPCTWNCAHHRCLVPCGSICARLPCDVRCRNELPCGHQCPSVCGENCNIQICPLCTTPDNKSTPVDLVMGRTLAEIDHTSEDLDELIITLPKCRHVFTVETLDGICSLGDFYTKNNDGKWRGLESPPNDFLTPPSCPTCRAPITSPRYGRVFKRADLDILERNVASKMSRGISAVNSALKVVSIVALKDAVVQAAAVAETPKTALTSQKMKETKTERMKLAKARRDSDSPLSSTSLDPGNTTYHGVSNAREWNQVVTPLRSAYYSVINVTGIRSSHLHAWEAAFSYLVRREQEKTAADPLRAPRDPYEHALRMATAMVGQPRPLADSRFRVEVFWTTIQIRFMLVELAQSWLTTVSKRSDYGPRHSHVWATYISFVLESCMQDSELAFRIAESSGSRRQMIKTRLLLMRSELEKFSFNVTMSQKAGTLKDRTSLLEAAKLRTTSAEAALRDARLDFSEDGEWLSENFVPMASKIIAQWKEIEKSLGSGTFYQEMTREEMEFVVKGLALPHTGHFYRCSNGHTFVIGDCGGANQVSRCPECGVAIGGTGHNLIAGNTRDMAYEEIARAQHVPRNPYGWGI